jgi:aminopeptidase N
MAGSNRQMASRVSAMLQYFTRTIGEAPYPDFTLTAVDDNLPGGHSPAFFAIFQQALPTTPYSWSDDPVAFDDNYKHLFLAHEVAHQWWGQAIGWKNYHEQWLSEGLAQYFAALYAAEDRGPAMLDTLIEAMRESTKEYFGQGPISLGYRLGHIKRDGRVFRAVVYNKSAVVLHMLRRLIGDDAFFSGLRRFYSTYRFKKAGTEDLQAAFEAGTSIKLDRFFDMWIRGFAKPAVRVAFENREEGGVIRVEQTRGTFDFPLTVSVQYADGKSEERTIKVLDKVVEERVPTPIRRVTVKDALTPVDIER